MKVLISAYACEPHKGSEPGVGWNWVQQIARFHEVWVITRANNREVIEPALRDSPSLLYKVHFVYYDLPPCLKFWKRGNRGVHLYYYLWQIGIYFLARKLFREIKFDIIHHVTFVNYWMPSFLALLPAKFVWGPVGGGEKTPPAFITTFSWRGKIHEFFRGLAYKFFEFDPFVRLTAKRSGIALAVTEQTATKVKQLGARNIKLLSQVGLSNDEIDALNTIDHHKKKVSRFLSIGNLLHWKGYHLGLRAFAELSKHRADCEYWVIGNGPERQNLEKEVSELNLAEKVKFWGILPRAEVLKKLSECDVFIHPSFHDSGAMVCSEALGAGLPVICLDLGGPALQVTEETGFKITAISPKQVVEDMAAAMKKLAESPELAWKMGEAGRKRVAEHFTWEAKGDFVNQIYRDVLSSEK